jgi:hypothetical protein
MGACLGTPARLERYSRMPSRTSCSRAAASASKLQNARTAGRSSLALGTMKSYCS